jgi:hypothetical protein
MGTQFIARERKVISARHGALAILLTRLQREQLRKTIQKKLHKDGALANWLENKKQGWQVDKTTIN